MSNIYFRIPSMTKGDPSTPRVACIQSKLVAASRGSSGSEEEGSSAERTGVAGGVDADTVLSITRDAIEMTIFSNN